jgi:hypothetical protein
MARIRTVKPEFWTSEQVMELSALARLVFIGLWNFCDDAGVHTANAKRLKAEVFPSDETSITEVGNLVAELIGQELVGEFEADGDRYWFVTGWSKHQVIQKPTYRHPLPPGWTKPLGSLQNHSRTSTELAPEHSGSSTEQTSIHSDTSTDLKHEHSTPEGKGKERKGKEGSESPRTRAARPQKKTIPEGFAVSEHVQQWAASKGYQDLEAHYEAFVSKATANGYTYVDWDAALKNAIRDDWAKLRQPGRNTETALSRRRVDL